MMHSTMKSTLRWSFIAALFAAWSAAVYAADPVKAGGPSDKPGRAVEAGDVAKPGDEPKKDTPAVGAKKKKKTAKNTNSPEQAGRALSLDPEKKRSLKHKEIQP